ncbi:MULTISPECIES: TetR/AcrR family transcriptional regulator [unclassified Parafrankia]|uniref:TetR/AcrR family transcriptional regulator n=1 Tax=Parafrankia sp. BMG5.11 TaxID=222540 RepID=UPI000DA486FF|nr:TetR/AcrR family transcriptional regulator [Parafrankia sp. BMG5.11]SQD95913.1 Transcriptional regulator, TetR family [Parafrankia sp. Ea1.12]
MPYRRTTAVDDRLAAARERLIVAATDLVADAGWAGASVTAVAAAADMSVGSVYQHFPSKSALVVEVFRRAADREATLISALAAVSTAAVPDATAPGAAEAPAAGGDPVDRLVQAVALFTRRALARRGLAYALLVAPSDPAVEAERLDFRRRYRDVFAALVREGVEAGSLPAQDPMVAAAALTGAIGEVLVGPVSMTEELPRGGREAERVVREVVAMALRCVGACPVERGWPSFSAGPVPVAGQVAVAGQVPAPAGRPPGGTG